ncbi:Gustatory receptor for sugar taste 64a [Eumeta japonica]|uniref:Gustatory receptor for sugar taste 64a n=1 Tax=Eumeta variegata TaxID=151549 RepID=A0A4C1UHY5_EUMVA|nr:Gustatory receptor for sugar taste 64a [Eumeta japonica]
MSSILRQARWFGVAGGGGRYSKAWGLNLLGVIFVVVGVSVLRVIRALTGQTMNSSGIYLMSGSVTVRLSGAIFYGNGLFSLLLMWRLASRWRDIARRWINVEESAFLNIVRDRALRRHMIMVTAILGVCTVGHYSLYIGIPVLIVSNLATCLWNFQDLVIILFSMGLASRYRRLNSFVGQHVKKENRCDNRLKMRLNIRLNVSTWRRIRKAYVSQAALVRCVDAEIGAIILLSNLNNLYFICLQLFLGITQDSGNTVNRVYYIASLVWLCVRACSVVLAAAEVHAHSKRALVHVYECPVWSYGPENGPAGGRACPTLESVKLDLFNFRDGAKGLSAPLKRVES